MSELDYTGAPLPPGEHRDPPADDTDALLARLDEYLNCRKRIGYEPIDEAADNIFAAAAEIRRLRAERDEFRAAANRLMEESQILARSLEEAREELERLRAELEEEK
jgi:chromosome segregation ATPase